LSESEIRVTVQGKRPGVPSVAIVITDGPSSSSSPAVVAEATLAHKAGITILAIATSPSVNLGELQLVSSAPRLVYHQWWSVMNFANLPEIQPLVSNTLCFPVYGTVQYASWSYN